VKNRVVEIGESRLVTEVIDEGERIHLSTRCSKDCWRGDFDAQVSGKLMMIMMEESFWRETSRVKNNFA